MSGLWRMGSGERAAAGGHPAARSVALDVVGPDARRVLAALVRDEPTWSAVPGVGRLNDALLDLHTKGLAAVRGALWEPTAAGREWVTRREGLS